jgi:hypothetical protein
MKTEKLKQSVQEYEQQGLEKYAHELETTRTMKTAEEEKLTHLLFVSETSEQLARELEGESDEEIQMEKELVKFLKYIKEVHVDDYGHLEICDSGDELDPTVERVVKEYMKSK